MMAAKHVRRVSLSLLSGSVLLALAGCAASRRAVPASGAAPASSTLGSATGGDTSTAASAATGAAAAGGGSAPALAPGASLQEQLQERTAEVGQLRAELERLRSSEHALRAASEQNPAGAAPGTVQAAPATGAGNADEVTALRASLMQEQQRREAAEAELTRLKQETTAPPFGAANVPEPEFLAAKQEIVELRRQLAEERQARDQMAAQAQQLVAAPPAAADTNPPAAAVADPAAAATENPEAAELRTQLRNLQDEKQAVVENLNRSLAASQQRVDELQKQIDATRLGVTPEGETDVNAIRAENAHLRGHLDEERKHTEELEGKLRVATRIADLIFKVQAQQAKAQKAPAKKKRRAQPQP